MNRQSALLALTVLVGLACAPAVAGENGREGPLLTRPDPKGKATRVSVRTYVVDIAEVDDTRRTFTADVYVLLRWKDPRLASSKAPRRTLPLSTIWHPGLLVFNQRNVNRLLPEVIDVDEQGNAEYRQRYQGTFSIHLDLRRFPLDEQSLAVRLVSPGRSPAELELVLDEHSGRAPQFSILDWRIASPTCQSVPLVLPDGREVAGCTCALAAHRQTMAYIYQFAIPLTFIVSMSWAAFWMAPEQLGPRQGIAVTSMLTVIAYRFILATQLPKVAYLTRFDYLLLGCTTLVFLALVQVVTAHALMTKGRLAQARRLDLGARGAFPAVFLVLILGVLLF